MVKRVTAPDAEPEQSNFKIPSPKEHLLQCVDYSIDKDNPDIISTKLEVVGGEEEGLSLLHRVNLDDKDKAFYFTRLFLKACDLPYKGSFDINESDFPGRQFYATIKHSKSRDGSKTYANIDTYNFDKKIEQFNVSRETSGLITEKEEIQWDK